MPLRFYLLPLPLICSVVVIVDLPGYCIVLRMGYAYMRARTRTRILFAGFPLPSVGSPLLLRTPLRLTGCALFYAVCCPTRFWADVVITRTLPYPFAWPSTHAAHTPAFPRSYIRVYLLLQFPLCRTRTRCTLLVPFCTCALLLLHTTTHAPYLLAILP